MSKKIAGPPEAWDERLLGADEQHIAAAGPEHDAALDQALDLKLISICLPESLIQARHKRAQALSTHNSVQPAVFFIDLLQCHPRHTDVSPLPPTARQPSPDSPSSDPQGVPQHAP